MDEFINKRIVELIRNLPDEPQDESWDKKWPVPHNVQEAVPLHFRSSGTWYYLIGNTTGGVLILNKEATVNMLSTYQFACLPVRLLFSQSYPATVRVSVCLSVFRGTQYTCKYAFYNGVY